MKKSLDLIGYKIVASRRTAQGVYWFMQWSMIVTWSLDVKMELARFTSLCPPRIRLPSLPRASPPYWFHIEVLSSTPVGFRSVFSTSDCLWIVVLGQSGLSPNLGVGDIFLVYGLSVLGPEWWCIRGSVSRCPVSRCRQSSLGGRISWLHEGASRGAFGSNR